MMTNSLGAEILVSSGHPRARASPSPPMQRAPSVDEPLPDTGDSRHEHEDPSQDEASKKSFKRK